MSRYLSNNSQKCCNQFTKVLRLDLYNPPQKRRTYWLVRTQCGKHAVFLHSSPILLDKSIKACTNRATGVNVVSVGSPSRIRIVRRISFGITTRPRSSIRLTIPVAFMFRTSFLAAAGASRIPVRALRKGFLHSRKGGSRPLCPHDGRLPHGGVRGYYLKKRQELYRVRIFFQEWFRILLIRLSDAEFLYKKRSPQRAHQRSPLRRSFFTVGERQSPGQPCPARVIRPRGSIPPRWSMQAT